MNDNRIIRIVVRSLEGQEGAYQASYVLEFLQAEFCVTVKDSIFGALTLQAFAEMIRKAFGKHYRKRVDQLRGIASTRLSEQLGATGHCGTRLLREKALGAFLCISQAHAAQDIPVPGGVRLFDTPEAHGRAEGGYPQRPPQCRGQPRQCMGFPWSADRHGEG